MASVFAAPGLNYAPADFYRRGSGACDDYDDGTDHILKVASRQHTNMRRRYYAGCNPCVFAAVFISALLCVGAILFSLAMPSWNYSAGPVVSNELIVNIPQTARVVEERISVEPASERPAVRASANRSAPLPSAALQEQFKCYRIVPNACEKYRSSVCNPSCISTNAINPLVGMCVCS